MGPVTIVRTAAHDDNANDVPTVIHMLKGRLWATWFSPSGSVDKVVGFDEGGKAFSLRTNCGLTVDPARLVGIPRSDRIIDGFKRDVLSRLNGSDFDVHSWKKCVEFPRETHCLHAGERGAILVKRMSDGLVDNPIGPAALRNGREVWFENGRETKNPERVSLERWSKPDNGQNNIRKF